MSQHSNLFVVECNCLIIKVKTNDVTWYIVQIWRSYNYSQPGEDSIVVPLVPGQTSAVPPALIIVLHSPAVWEPEQHTGVSSPVLMMTLCYVMQQTLIFHSLGWDLYSGIHSVPTSLIIPISQGRWWEETGEEIPESSVLNITALILLFLLWLITIQSNNGLNQQTLWYANASPLVSFNWFCLSKSLEAVRKNLMRNPSWLKYFYFIFLEIFSKFCNCCWLDQTPPGGGAGWLRL